MPLGARGASPTGELAYSTVTSSRVITKGVAAPGDADLGGDLGCGDGMVAEGVGDDRCWHFQNVLADGGGAASAGRNTQLADQAGEAAGVHRLACSAAGKQPPGVGVGGGVHVVPRIDPAQYQPRERGRDR